MAALATQADVEARIGTLTAAQAARVDALLADASAKVRAFCRQTFDVVASDQVVLSPVGAVIRLPQRPITAVTSVALIDGTTDIPLTGWAWDGAELLDLTYATTVAGSTTTPVQNTNTYRVTYSHGSASSLALEVAKGKVCELVARTITAPSVVDGMVSETIGQYGYTLQQSGGSQGTAVRLTQADKQDLIDLGLRRQSGSVLTRAR